MYAQWQKIFIKITFWLIVEIILNFVGLDNLADYSEFIFEQKAVIATSRICELSPLLNSYPCPEYCVSSFQ
jgi:hypothetical protein